MGNKANRHNRRRKSRFDNSKNFYKKPKDDDTIVVNAANNVTTGETLTQSTAVRDLVSILLPINDIKLEQTSASITPLTETRTQEDPLLVVKTERKSPSIFAQQSIEYLNVAPANALMKIELNENESSMNDEPNSIPLECKKCRLCLTEEENNWIEIFSSKPFPYTNVVEITRSNIVESIEQFTTIKISKDDRLSDRICLNCFQSLRFIHRFREKSLHSQTVLRLEASAMNKSPNESNEQQDVSTNGIPLQPIKRLVKVIHLKQIPKPVPTHTKRLRSEEADSIDKEIHNYDRVQCEICGATFEKYKELQYHLSRHHDVGLFACTEAYCDKTFHSPQNLRSHIHNMHLPIERKQKCDICGKMCNNAKRLANHRTSHFPPTIPCKICGKLLRTQSSVRQHRASHADRLYKCDDCGKAFQNGYTLRVHQRMHTNEKPFICSKCGEAFAHKCSLKTHDEKKHPE